MAEAKQHQYVVCLHSGGYDIDLIVRKIYRVVEPHANDGGDEIRIVDESGEDYLYPRDWFAAVDLPQQAIETLEAA
jgi:hypothetical protein